MMPATAVCICGVGYAGVLGFIRPSQKQLVPNFSAYMYVRHYSSEMKLLWVRENVCRIKIH